MTLADRTVARPGRWIASGLNIDPAVKRALKADAALHGISMQLLLHRILVDHLDRRGLLGGGRREAPDPDAPPS